MSEGAGQARIADNPAAGRYEAHVGDHLAGLITYERGQGRITFLHTETEPGFEGMGIASRLASRALDDARARGLAVTPVCPFVASFIRRHAEYADLVTR